MDMTYRIPYYSVPETDFPPDPDNEIPDREKERLFNELCVLIDSGAFDPEKELPF